MQSQPNNYKDTGVKNGNLAAPVNNTFVRHTSFLAADTPPCVLICTTNVLCVANTSYMYVCTKYLQLAVANQLAN